MRQNTSNTGANMFAIPESAGIAASAVATGGLIFSTPVIDEQEIIYAGSSDHSLYAYNPRTKKIQWTFATKEVIDSAAALHPNGTIIVPSGDGSIYCISKEGEKLWSFDVTKHRTHDQFSFATSYWWEGNIAIDDEGYIYAGNDDFFLYCITPEGTLKWKFRTGLFIWASVVFGAPNIVYASSFDGAVYALWRTDGTLLWKTDMRNPLIASPAIHGDILLQCTLGGTLIALNRHTGQKLWTQRIPQHVYASPLITPDGNVITASSSGEILAFSIAAQSLVWSWKEFSVIRSSPVLGPDPEKKSPYLVYCGNADGHLFALDSAGALRWRFQTTPKDEHTQKFVINGSLALGTYGLAAPVGKYIYYLPYNHYLSPAPDIVIPRPPQLIIPLADLAQTNTYILDNIHITSPAIIPTLDQIGLQSLDIVIGVIARSADEQTFLAHGTLIFGRGEDGALIGVPHSQTYSFAFYGTIAEKHITFTAQNIFFETSGFPFPLDTLQLQTSQSLIESNTTLRAEVIERGPIKTFASIILAYNSAHPPQSIIRSIQSIEDVFYIIRAFVELLIVSTKFLVRKYWDTWDLFDDRGSIHCVGMASLCPLPASQNNTSMWTITSFSFNELAKKIQAQLETTSPDASAEELSILVADRNTLQPIPINYSKLVKHKRISNTRIQISLHIPEMLTRSSNLTAYVVDKTTLLQSYNLYPANPGK